ARKRLQSAPLAGTQALGRGQLLYMHRVGSVGFSVGPISAFWLGGAGLSPRLRIRTSSLNENRLFCLL
ncbi:MAG: hypothetical protein VXW00_10025, partial [Candidatus Latescibacterota bacterium]|nr:hypothetical protein [Candidatus Latescibacterota bacterium]